MTKEAAAVRDQLGKDPDVTFYLNPDYSESIGAEEQSTIIKTNTIGHSFILGHPTNGVLGTANGVDGQQIVLGEAGRSGEVVVRVVNPNNVFKERFRDTTFKDSSQPNTANWDTTLFRLAMHTSSNHSTAYNTIATTPEIFLNLETVIAVKINADETRFNANEVIKYFITADGGSNWQEIPFNTDTTLTFPGTDLRLKIQFLGNGGLETYIENLQVQYTI